MKNKELLNKATQPWTAGSQQTEEQVQLHEPGTASPVTGTLTACSQARGVCQEKKSVHDCLSKEMSMGLLVGPASCRHTKLMTLLYLKPDLEGHGDPFSYTSCKT